jgi:hypothetical protein
MNHPNDRTKTDSLNTRNLFPLCRPQAGLSFFHTTSKLMLGAALGVWGICASASLLAADASAPATTASATTAASADTSAPATSAATTAAAAPAASSATGSAPAAAASAPAARSGRAAASPVPWDRPADGPPVFTEDFESGVLNDKTWTLHVAGKPTATVEQDNVAHGKNALHIHYPAHTTTKEWAFAGIPVPVALRDHFYGRAYVFINAMPSGHCVLMLAGTTGFPVANFLEIGMRQNQFQPSFQQNGPNVPRFEDHPSEGTPPIGRWFCLEWEFNDKPDQIVMWIDGKLSVNKSFSMNGVKTGLTGGFSEFNLGFRSWSAPAKDVDIYYDDIAIGDKPIGQLSPVMAKPAVTTDAKPAAATDAKPATSADTKPAADTSTPAPAKATN